MRNPLRPLALALVLVAAPAAFALTEAELLGTWDLTSYLAVRETSEGSYHLVLDDTQRSTEYPLLLRLQFQRNGSCTVTRALADGRTETASARFQKQTVEGQEFIRLRFAAEEVTVTLRAIVPDNVTTLFFLSTTQGQGRFSSYLYDTFGSMEKVGS